MKKITLTCLGCIVCLAITAQNVGIGNANPQQTLDVSGKIHASNGIGIGVMEPAGQLHLSNTTTNRKIILWTNSLNDHQYYGFGINNGALRYQVDDPAASHIFYSAASGFSSNELMRIKGNGNVGINNPVPSYRLDVVGSSRIFGDFILTSANTGGTWFYLTNSSGTPSGWKFITAGTASITGAGALMLFNDNNVSRLNIFQNGAIGIGTSNPQGHLHVAGSLKDMGIFESTSTIGTWLSLQNSSAGGGVWNLISTGATNGEGAGNLLFNNTATGTQTTLLANGNFGLGVTSPDQRLEVYGSMQLWGGRVYFSDRYFRMSGYTDNAGSPNGIAVLPHADNYGGLGASGNYWDDGHITEIWYNDLYDVSDRRSKMNIQPLGSVLSKIQQLQPIRFDINPVTHPGYKNARPEEIEVAKGTMGFTAQNIQEVFPSMVVYNEELGVYTIRNYHQLLSVLTQGMKEQQNLIEQQAEKMRQLEAKLNRLENK